MQDTSDGRQCRESHPDGRRRKTGAKEVRGRGSGGALWEERRGGRAPCLQRQ